MISSNPADDMTGEGEKAGVLLVKQLWTYSCIERGPCISSARAEWVDV